MAAITISDLNTGCTLDHKAMSFIRGASAGWLQGAFVPFRGETPAFGPVLNLYQINNSFYANQMQIIDVDNSGANSNINLVSVVNASQVK